MALSSSRINENVIIFCCNCIPIEIAAEFDDVVVILIFRYESFSEAIPTSMSSTPDRSCSSLSQDSSYSSNASSSSRYSLDSPSSCGSSSTQADTARVKKPAYKFLGVLNQECPNYAQCQGEIEVWKNLRKDEVFVQCSGDVRDCRYSTKIATYSTCCVCGESARAISLRSTRCTHDGSTCLVELLKLLKPISSSA